MQLEHTTHTFGRRHRIAQGLVGVLLAVTGVPSDPTRSWADAPVEGGESAAQVGLAFPRYLQGSACEIVPDSVPAQENVGEISAQSAVSGGQSSYQVPIVVPPGRRGLQPSLQLAYSSGGGDGIAGFGWTLSGASRIHRCPATAAQDGTVHGVDFTGRDRLCLDGQRLVLVNGSYGQNGSEYRTEIDSFARITLQGGMSSSTSSFRVDEKGGNVSLYGSAGSTTAVETPIGAAAPFAWWIGRTQDRQKNSILYEYLTIAGQFLLTSIRYTGVEVVAGNRRVLIGYERRPDISSQFIAGAMVRRNQRVMSITSDVAGQVVRRYELSYSTSRATGRSLLGGITECTSIPCSASTRLPPTTFVYSDEAPTYTSENIPGGDGEKVSDRLISDYDGDGAREWLRTETAFPWGGPVVRRELHHFAGEVEDVTNEPWADGLDRVFFGRFGLRSHGGNLDFDQDGRADLLGVSNGAFAIKTRSGVKTSNLRITQSTLLWHVADFDGNGKSDLLVTETGQSSTVSNIWLQVPSSSSNTLHFQLSPAPFPRFDNSRRVLSISDYDGNGLPDAFVDWDGLGFRRPDSTDVEPRIVFTHRNGSGLSFVARAIRDVGGPAGSFPDARGRAFIDINGDDLLDLYELPGSFWLNRGGTFSLTPVVGTITLARRFYDDAMPVDWDMDGRTELLVPNQVRVPWCYDVKIEPEPRTYCSTPGSPTNFGSSGAPEDRDRTVYQWDAIEFGEDAQGRLTLSRRSTPIEAPIGASTSGDWGGDGLNDLMFILQPLYGERRHNTAVAGFYTRDVEHGNKIARHRGPVPDLLRRVITGLGRVSSWDYKPLSSRDDLPGCTSPVGIPFYTANYEAPRDGEHFLFTSSMYVVARYEESNGLGGTNGRCFRYEDAMANNQGRGFLGFRKIFEEEALPDTTNNLRTTTTYRQEFPLVSAVENVSVALASDPPATSFPVRETRNQWAARCQDDADPATPTGRYCFVYTQQSETAERDLNPLSRSRLQTTTIVNTYSPVDITYGNVSSTETRIQDTTGGRLHRESFTYDYQDAGAWWLVKLTQKTLTVEAATYAQSPFLPSSTHPENSQQVLTTHYEYHPNSHAVLSRLLWAETVQPGSATEKRTAFGTFDSFGNPTRNTVTAGSFVAPRETRLTYTADGYFKHTEINPLGHEVTSVVDPETGTEITRTDANGLTVRAELDAFGRVTRTVAPGVDPKHVRMLACNASCPSTATIRRLTIQNGTPSTRGIHRPPRPSREDRDDGVRRREQDRAPRGVRCARPADSRKPAEPELVRRSLHQVRELRRARQAGSQSGR